MLQFDNNGRLYPYEIIETDSETIEKVFVEEIAFSTSRRTIFENLKEYNQLLKEIIGSDCKQWIDGSFVTLKRNPKDVDVITWIDFEEYERHEKQLEKLKQWRFDKLKMIDGYFIKTYPPQHKRYKFYEYDCQEWAFVFHKVRQSKTLKGFLQITI